MKLFQKIEFIFLLSICLSACIENNFVEYKPHYLSKTKNRYYGKPELEQFELKNTIQVLEYYEEDYKVQDSTIILITQELNDNWELLWNYTTKANDLEWLETHKPR